jgi:hypothetical protein
MSNIIKESIRRTINRLPYINRLFKELSDYKRNSWVPPGHYYSPVVNKEEIGKRKEWIFRTPPAELKGIDLRKDAQFALLESFTKYHDQIRFSSHQDATYRYYFENRYFTYADGTSLFLVLSHFQPSRIIEVGSGFSSALMLDIADSVLKNRTELSFIEPFPDTRLMKLVRPGDKFNLVERFLQDIDVDFFKALKANDVLFIDSSHVVKTGSELNYLLFDIFPILAPGVIIHFHDIFYPFEYPQDWVNEGRSWNEAYFLRAFLMHNSDFEILLFTSYLQQTNRAWLEKNLPLLARDRASSLWLVKK